MSKLAEYIRLCIITRSRHLTLKKIAQDTGLRVTFLDRLIARSNKEYSAEKLEILYTYFTGKELEL